MLPEHPLVQSIQAFDPGVITGGKLAVGELTIEIDPAKIVPLLKFLKTEMQFDRLSSVTAVDWHPEEPRFEVVYHLHSVPNNQRVRLKCRLGGDQAVIASATSLYAGADWYEREVFDLFGVTFTGHPNLTRILLPDYWEGHPLRRDFPVDGHKYSYQND